MPATRDNSWFAEWQLYIRHRDKYLQATVRTNVKVTAAGSTQPGPARADRVTVTLATLGWPGWSQTPGTGVCLLTALWGGPESVGNSSGPLWTF